MSLDSIKEIIKSRGRNEVRLPREKLTSEQLIELLNDKDLENIWGKVEYLDLANNKLRSLRKEIGNLKNLRHLDLQYNQLKLLPKAIGNLTNLYTLNIHRNKLTSLPKEIGKLKLMYGYD